MKEYYAKLKNSEKILIYIMILVIIAGGGSIVIRPMYKKYNKVREQYDAICLEKQVTQMELNQYDSYNTSKETLENFYEQNQNYLEPLAGESYVQQRISSFLERYSLKPESILLEGGYNNNPSDYKGLDSNVGEDEDNPKLIDQEGEALKENVGGEKNLYQAVSVTMSTKGNLQQFCSFLDGCKKEKAFLVTDFSVHKENQAVSYHLYANEQLVFYITAVYYMKSY